MNVRADCNRGSATYVRNGSSLGIGPIALTRMACPSESRDAEFVKGLGNVSGHAHPRQRPRADVEGGLGLDAVHVVAAVARRADREPRCRSTLADRHALLAAFVALEWVIRIAMLVIVPFRRSPDAAKGWLLLILFEPILGLALYLVFGRRRLPAWRLRAGGGVPRACAARFARASSTTPTSFHPAQDPSIAPGIHLAEKLGEMPILGGNTVEVLSDYDDILDRLVADIDAARSHVHLLFYIIADDAVAGRVIAALERAAARGVACRVLADALGSRGVRLRGDAAEAARCRHRSVRDDARWHSSGSAARAWICATTARSRSSTRASATPDRSTSSIRISSPGSPTRN